MQVATGFKELLFPYGVKCPLCGELAPRKKDPLCKKCRSKIDDMIKGYRPCIKCGRFIPENEHFCSECETGIERPFELARAASPYEGIVKEQVHLFKYLKKRSLAEAFAAMMLKVLKAERAFRPIDAIVAVPMHDNRLQERTFNQAEDLAMIIANKLKKPYLEEVLWRTIDTPTQVSLSRQQRANNLKKAFSVLKPDAIKDKNLLLIDDIFTTGTTVSETAKVLKNNGALRVAVLTLATGKLSKYSNK